MSSRDLQKSPLAAFLREHGAGILSAWERAARRRTPDAMVPARGPLREELPAVLERIAERLDGVVAATQRSDDDASDGDRDSWSGFDALVDDLEEPVLGPQALDRLRDAFELDDVAAEYALLRRCVLRRLEETGTQPSWVELTILHEALDQAILYPAARSAALRERAHAAIDRTTVDGAPPPAWVQGPPSPHPHAAAAGSPLDRSLRRLLDVLSESARRIEWAAVLLFDGEVLRVRAATGPDDAHWRGRAYKPAVGFIGRVVRERRPVALRSAALDPLAHDAGGADRAEPGTRGQRAGSELHALYGAPLLADTRLLGVAVASSRRVAEFSEADRALFRKVVDRAATLVLQTQLREQLAAERGRMEALVHRLPLGVAVADAPAGAVSLCNRRFVEILRGPDEIPSSAPYHRAILEARDDDEPARGPLARALCDGTAVAGEEIDFLRGDGEIRRGSFGATPVRDAEGSVIAVVLTVEDVTDRRRAEQARRVLCEAAALLVKSLDDDDAGLEAIVRLAGEGLADACLLDLLDERGAPLRRLGGARDAARRALLPRLVAHGPSLGEGSPFADALAHAGPTLVPRVADAWITAAAAGPEALAPLRELGARSALLVPLGMRGRAVGLLSLWSTQRELTQDDAPPAQELGRLMTLALEAMRLRVASGEAVLVSERRVTAGSTEPPADVG